jgi:hypothetical protein
MESIISNYLQHLAPGTMQTFQNMAVVPLTTALVGDREYVTLNEAMEKGFMTITEIDESGSVPELNVVNSSEHQIFLMDGEELAGAKQNRVLNTSILLKERSETTIPVSCTELGRWAYTSGDFHDSGAVMASRARSSKLRAVSGSLRGGRGHTSDQGQIWSEIDAMHAVGGTSSPTRAMRDIYTQKEEDLGGYRKSFELVPDQQGCLVFINGEVAGLDILSLQSAYQRIHPQLVQSYAVDALLQQPEKPQAPDSELIDRFLESALKCNEARFDAVSQGHDYRYDSTGVVGSTLVCDEDVIHMAFFGSQDADTPDTMSSSTQRGMFRRFRRS